MVLDQFGTIGWGGNSGFHCIQLALQFGARKIILVGFDMRIDRGIHWHGLHGGKLNNPSKRNVERWRRVVDEAFEVLDTLDIPAFNCSPVSALREWPKKSFVEALNAD